MLYDSDKRIAENIFQSYQSAYYHKRNSHLIHKLISATLPLFREYLDLPSDLKFRIASLKGWWEGRYYSQSKTVELDVKTPWNRVLETLSHELVHAEQFHTKKLKIKYEKGRWISYWHGVPVRAVYMKRPWEIEAYDRQSGLAKNICTIMEEKHDQAHGV